MRKSKRVKFPNGRGQTLSGILETPVGEVLGYGMFMHCFTCGKDLKAIVKMCRELAQMGWAVLRFDFTGLGDSQGEFSETNFDTNCDDILSAADFLATEYQAPTYLVGHSLGGTAMLAIAEKLKSVKALTTLASPGSTKHLALVLTGMNSKIVSDGEGKVVIGGREFLLKRQLIDNLESHDVESKVKANKKPIMLVHPANDDTLPLEESHKIFDETSATKAMIVVDGADHLLVDQLEDPAYVAGLINVWNQRHCATGNAG